MNRYILALFFITHTHGTTQAPIMVYGRSYESYGIYVQVSIFNNGTATLLRCPASDTTNWELFHLSAHDAGIVAANMQLLAYNNVENVLKLIQASYTPTTPEPHEAPF